MSDKPLEKIGGGLPNAGPTKPSGMLKMSYVTIAAIIAIVPYLLTVLSVILDRRGNYHAAAITALLTFTWVFILIVSFLCVWVKK